MQETDTLKVVRRGGEDMAIYWGEREEGQTDRDTVPRSQESGLGLILRQPEQ